MKVGDLVKNTIAVRTNPVVNESRGWHPIEAGYLGIVTSVRQTPFNAGYFGDGGGDVYVDVLLSVDGGSVHCGNYLESVFEAVQR